MENYIVSARKYRPATFQSVVGQKSLTTTLKNAIRNNKLAHAYLFCGPRGVGKTTCARIFAKTINCLTPTTEGESCNQCESCVSFNENRSYNIHELDAASNNSVEDIRTLIEQVRIPPQLGKYKVYIIDEVHMLSAAAFNAFLKTLEEPPKHAIFILATTEKHKILPTILSRCQIYDFSRININDTVEHLQYVAQQENVTAEPEALNVIALKADGGMRDALSIFDQVVSFTGGNITYKAVIDNLNVLDYEYYFKLTESVLQGNVSSSMLLLNEILGKGFDGQHIVGGFASFFRDLLVCKDPQTLVLFEVGDAVRERYRTCAQQCSNAFLYKAIELINECDLNYRVSRNKRLLVELLLIRLCQLASPTADPENDKKKSLEPVEARKKEELPVLPKASEPENRPVAPTAAAGRDTAPLQSSPVGTQPNREVQKTRRPLPPNAFSISLKGNNQQEKEDRPVSVKTEAMNSTFTETELINAWKMYAETLKEKLHLKNTMLNILPVLKTDSQFEVSVYNPEQAQKLHEEAPSLIGFLQQRLHNSSIRMSIHITEENNKQLAYTDTEKYKVMVSQNSCLQNLVKEFDLRLD